MNSKAIFEQITHYLTTLARDIKVLNRLNLTDNANYAEDLFARILNTTYDYQLGNVNETKANTSTIDLYDAKRKLVVQVTSENTVRRKYTATRRSFLAPEANKDYDTLIILFITDVKIPSELLKPEKLAGDKQIWAMGLPQLLSKIKSLPIGKKKEILGILDDELATDDHDQSKPIRFDAAALKFLKVPFTSTELHIDRSLTIQRLADATKEDNCLVIGKPGIGKSFVLSQFHQYCWERGHISILIPVNELISGSDEEIAQLLKTSHHWLEYLAAYKGRAKCFLIFDAFDTAKEEVLKNNVLQLISSALKRLFPKWKVLVSVREYDAYRSYKLLQLFSKDRSAELTHCNRFAIDRLGEDEVILSLSHSPATLALYEKCTKGLREVLRIPYFLKIFYETTNPTDQTSGGVVKTIHTEEQLLHWYWQRKITHHPAGFEKELLLKRLTTRLYEIEKLSADKSSLLTLADTGTLSELISEGILSESGVFGRNIAFSHNILFDYALARLLIKSEREDFIAQIEANHKKPFLFRPSYLYFLNQIWKEDRQQFWKLYTDTWKIRRPPFTIMHQAFFNTIVAASYTSLEELAPLFALQRTEEGGLLLFRYLNTLRFVLQDNVRVQDAALIHHLAQNIHPDYLWILGYFIDKCFQSPQVAGKTSAQAAIHYLQKIMVSRKTDVLNRSTIDFNGGLWGVENICRALKFEQTKAATLIEECLTLLHEEDFPIPYFHRLADAIIGIARLNPHLAQKVFTSIYAHTETSNKETYLGSGVIVGLRSNRKQDFYIIYHRLEAIYPEFLKVAPQTALLAGIDLLNQLKQWGYGKKVRPISIQLFDIKGKFVSDGSIGEWEHEYEEGVGKLINELFTFLEENLKDSPAIEKYLHLCYRKAQKSFFWKNLIKFYTRHVQLFYRHAITLLQNDVFYLANETCFETGELLKILIPHLSKAESKQLEKRILALGSSPVAKHFQYHYVEDTVLTFLSCFPPSALQYSYSWKLIKEHGPMVNVPIVSGGVQVSRGTLAASLDEFLGHSSDPLRNTLRHLDGQLQRIEATGEVLTLTQAEEFMNLVEQIQLNRNNTEEEKLAAYADEVMLKTVGIICKRGKNFPTALKSRCLFIAQIYLAAPALQKKVYELGERSSRAVYFVPNLRTKAAEIISHLAYSSSVKGLDQVIKQLLTDNDSIARMYAIRSLVYFKRKDKVEFLNLTMLRLSEETDDYCLMQLLQNLCYLPLIKEYPHSIEQFLTIVTKEISHRKRDSIFLKQYAELLLAAVYTFDSAVAKQLARQQYLNAEFTQVFISKALDWIERPLQDKTWKPSPHFNANIYQEFAVIITEVINYLQKAGLQDQSSKSHFSTLDHMVMRIFFVLNLHKEKRKTESGTGLYFGFKPTIKHFLTKSYELGDGGLMIAHTGYYLIQLLEEFLHDDPADVLKMLYQLTDLASKTGFAGEKTTLEITLKVTETYLSDYKELILQDEYFHYLVQLLRIYVESGWHEALEFIWRLNEIL